MCREKGGIIQHPVQHSRPKFFRFFLTLTPTDRFIILIRRVTAAAIGYDLYPFRETNPRNIKKEAIHLENKKSGKFANYLKEQNIEFSVQRIFIDGLGAMAHGLFASLLIGCIINTIGTYVPVLNAIVVNPWASEALAGANLLIQSKTACYAVQGAAMGVAIAYAMKAPPFVIYSCCAVGYAANALGGAGGPLAVFFVVVCAVFCGKLVSKRTPLDIIVTPFVTIVCGVTVAFLIGPPIGKLATALGVLVMKATALQPFLMGMFVSALVGILLTLPISSAAICAGLGLLGLAGGAAVAGCCAHMVGFAVASYRENKSEGLLSIGLGTSMLLVPNLVRKPILWLPAVITSIVNGPVAICLFKLQHNGLAINSGMGTAGLCGPISMITGWLDPTVANDPSLGIVLETAYVNPAMNWIGLVVCCFVIPAVGGWLVSEIMRKKGWIQPGDYQLQK